MEIWRLNLRHLRAIAHIAELGTMNAAAAAVNLTQPAITQALVRIEGQLGQPLFERRHDGMAATDAAHLLVPRIRAALGHIASPHVTMSRMRALLALAESGSYGGASAGTGLSLPSLHRAVGDLALSLRRSLVERRGKAVVLTDAGMAQVRAFRLARVELETGLAELDALRGHETRRIVIGAMPLARARVRPAATARFLARHPKVRVSIIEGSRAELVEPLRNGLIDLTVGGLRDPLMEPDLAQTALFFDRPAVIARAGHPLAGTEPDLKQLVKFPWVASAHGAPLRDTLERAFADAKLPAPQVPVESGSAMIIRQLLLDSDWLSVLSPDQVAVELEAGWLTRVAQLPPGYGRTIGVTTRTSWRPTLVQADFLSELQVVGSQAGEAAANIL